MTTREEIILQTALKALDEADGPIAEAMLQMQISTRLGSGVTVAELDKALKYCDTEQLATGLPGAFGKRRWMITDKGRHTLSQL